MFVVPSTFNYSLDEITQVAKEIQQGILPNKHPDHIFHPLTWHEIVNTNHHLKPANKVWDLIATDNIHGPMQIVFFVNIEYAREIVETHPSLPDFQVDSQNENTVITFCNNEFEEHLDLMSMIAASLWSAEDLSCTAAKHMRTLPANFRLYHAIFNGLKKRFPTASFWRTDRQLYMMQDSLYGSINYRSIAKAIRFSKQSIDLWLKSLTPRDLLMIDEHAAISLRSFNFQKARPTALCQAKDKYVLAVEIERDQRLGFVPACSSETDVHRFEHYLNEAERHLGHRKFLAHAYLHKDGPYFGAAVIGDQIASIAAFPELVYGAVHSLDKIPQSLRVLSTCEDILVVVDANAPASLVDDLQKKAVDVLQALYADGSDPLYFDCVMKTPRFPCGEFLLLHIPAPYFELLEAANDSRIALPPGRVDYLRGLAFELIHEWKLAVVAFRRALSFDAADGDISYALGRAMTEVGHHEEALTFLEKAFAVLPEDPDVANSLGIAYLECEQKENAARVLEHAADMQPDDVQTLSNLGRCYFANQRLKDAETVLTKALEFAPHFSEAHATLAQVRWRLGDVSSARKHARKAFAANPSNKCVQDLLWALTVDDDENA